MFAQINHMAMISPHYATLGKFYEAVFGLKTSTNPRPAQAVTVGDGCVGLNIIPRRDGYVGGIDHFGMLVDDVAPVLERMQKKHPKANVVKRPSARPFAQFSGHDPDGNVFDLAQKKEDTRKDVYADIASQGWAQDRYLNKFAIRTPNAEALRRILSRRVRARAGEPHIASARLPPDRRPRDALDHAVVDPGVREHVDQAPRPRSHRLPRRGSRRLQGSTRPKSAA